MKILQAKINGVIELSEPMEETSDYSIALEQCSVKRIETKKEAEDDKEITTFFLESLGRVNILTEKEKKPYLIKGKMKKTTQSQLLRLQIEAEGYDYPAIMSKIIEKWRELI